MPRSAAKLLARDEARRIAANIAKLDLLGRGWAASPDHLPGLFGSASASVTRSNRRKQGGTVPAASRAEFARWRRAANNRRRVAIRQMCGGPSTAAVWEVAARRCRGASGRYDDAPGFRQQIKGQSVPKGCVMKTVADDCWQIAAQCEHWAEESQDDATRLAFRQIARALAGLAFSDEFGPTEGLMDSEDLEATLSEHTPPSPSFEMPLAEHEDEDLESDVDAEVDAENRAPTQRLSLPSRTPFPRR
jgi:hypothetical protein